MRKTAWEGALKSPHTDTGRKELGTEFLVLWSLQGRSDYKRTYARMLWKKNITYEIFAAFLHVLIYETVPLKTWVGSISELLQIKISWGRGGKQEACPHTPLAAYNISAQLKFSMVRTPWKVDATPLLYTHQGWVEAGRWADHVSTRASAGSQKPNS